MNAKEYLKEINLNNTVIGTDRDQVFKTSDAMENYAYLKSKEDNRELVEMLKSAKCPDCDGSGTIVNEVTRTGVRWVDDGHGNPIAEPEPMIGYEPSPCQWCYEKDKIIQNHTS